jgi:predicted dehydrogenase
MRISGRRASRRAEIRLDPIAMDRKCLLIGLGRIGMGYDLEKDPGERILTHARALAAHPAFDLVAAVDAREERRTIFEQMYGQPAYPDVDAAIEAVAPTVVVVATPTETHSALIRQLLRHPDVRMILCEKPLAYDVEEARSVVRACEAADVGLFVNYIRRSDPGVIEVRSRIRSGHIAQPLKGTAWYSKGLLHNGSHLFDLLNFWLGKTVRSEVLNAGRAWDERDAEPDVLVEFELGRVVFLAAWEEAFSHHMVELLSSSGRLRYERGGEMIVWQGIGPDQEFPEYMTLTSEPEIIPSDMHRYQWHVMDQLSSAMNNAPASLCTGRQALNTLEAMREILDQRDV